MPNILLLPLLLIIYSVLILPAQQQSGTSEGYVLFCPCMGRFGNQIEQLLGVLAFAAHLNRTLVLPPLIEYPLGSREAQMRPFESLFQLAPIFQFHRVVSMEEFMREIAHGLWPTEQRKVFCWSPRAGLVNPHQFGCHATEGNPFGPFWRHSNISFTGEEFFGQKTGGFDTDNKETRQKWLKHFPIGRFPVLAFSSAPAAFPMHSAHSKLQRYIKWTEQIEANARATISQMFGVQPFLAIHLRNGPDWENVCRHLADDGPLPGPIFASQQCTGEDNQFGTLTLQVCSPSLDTLLNDIYTQVLRIGAHGVFVASDWRHHLSAIQSHLDQTIQWPVKVAKLDIKRQQEGHIPSIELAILGQAHHFIGNCVSTFSAFVVRQRLYGKADDDHKFINGAGCSFFAFPAAALERLNDDKMENQREEL